MTTYNITVDVRVDDRKQLFNAAMLHATKEDGMTYGEAEDMLKPFGNIDHPLHIGVNGVHGPQVCGHLVPVFELRMWR